MQTTLTRYDGHPELFAEIMPRDYEWQPHRLRFGYLREGEWAELVILENMTMEDAGNLLVALVNYRCMLRAEEKAEAAEVMQQEAALAGGE